MAGNDWTEVERIVAEVLAANGGVARIGRFLERGLSRHQVAAAYRKGMLERPRNAWYVDPALPWQVKQAIRVGGLATCSSAAKALGLPVAPEEHPVVHVSVERNAAHFRHHKDKRRYVAAGEDELVRMHWAARVRPPTGWGAGLLDVLLHLEECASLEWYVAALDAALHEPRDHPALLSRVEFVHLVQHLPRRARRALRLVDPRSESPIESLLRLGLVRRGIGSFDLQVWTTPGDRVDILVRGRLILEADGKEFHDPERDAIRDALMRSLGYTVLRFPYERIVFDLEAVLDEIEAALAFMSRDGSVDPSI